MARILIVGCGCRGGALARALIADGQLVRGTTRSPERAGEIRATGAEPYVGDPLRPGTLIAALQGVSAVCWLMGGAAGEHDDVAPLHGRVLRHLLEEIVDTPVRGLVYEAAGTVAPELLAEGTAIAREAQRKWHMPIAVLERQPEPHEAWLAAARECVDATLGK